MMNWLTRGGQWQCSSVSVIIMMVFIAPHDRAYHYGMPHVLAGVLHFVFGEGTEAGGARQRGGGGGFATQKAKPPPQ